MSPKHTPAAPVLPGDGRLRPLGLDEVQITGGFWADRQKTNAVTTLPHIAHWLEREGWISNYDLAAAGLLPAGRRGREFSDSEIYKFLEAAAWELARRPDPKLEATFREFVNRVAAAQEPDGYLNTAFGRPGQGARWSDLAWGHELYCLGHLFQAAVARARTAPDADDGLVGVACRAADLVCEVFGDRGIESVCGHPEVELGLAELARATGDARYLRQAKLFIDRRGHRTLPDHEWGRGYFQDDLPIRQAEVLHGHAVRANYLAAGAVDVAVETGDQELLDDLTEQWRNTVARRTYLTGGQGSHYQDEAFGDDFELPPDRAYAETCAAIASVMFSWRLLLATGESTFSDLIERTLYNVVATAVAESGDAFFYTNTLHRRVPGEAPDPNTASPRAFSSLRAPWFDVSCCPPNIARTMASVACLFATSDADGLQVHHYAPATVRTQLDDGTTIALSMVTDYPESGRVRLLITETAGRDWTLSLRIPSWAASAELRYRPVDGLPRDVPIEGRVARVTAAFNSGDELELELPMAPHFVLPDPRIDAVRGCVAVERGPIVYCAEEPAGGELEDNLSLVRVTTDAAPIYRGGNVLVAGSRIDPQQSNWPYAGGTAESEHSVRTEFELIPYHSWGQRGLCTMRVWLPAG